MINTELQTEVGRRKTFAIISHPDAGKTTMTDHMPTLPIVAISTETSNLVHA